MRAFCLAFLEGLAALAWFPEDDAPPRIMTPTEALASDWNAVARDFSAAVEKINREDDRNVATQTLAFRPGIARPRNGA